MGTKGNRLMHIFIAIMIVAGVLTMAGCSDAEDAQGSTTTSQEVTDHTSQETESRTEEAPETQSAKESENQSEPSPVVTTTAPDDLQLGADSARAVIDELLAALNTNDVRRAVRVILLPDIYESFQSGDVTDDELWENIGSGFGSENVSIQVASERAATTPERQAIFLLLQSYEIAFDEVGEITILTVTSGESTSDDIFTICYRGRWFLLIPGL